MTTGMFQAESCIEVVRQHLQKRTAKDRPDDAGGSVAAAAAELKRRAEYCTRQGFRVRVSAAVEDLARNAISHPGGWG